MLPTLGGSAPGPRLLSTALPEPARSVYRHGGFTQFLVARLLAVLATQVQAVVVAWQVYDLTREPIALAYVCLLYTSPSPRD